MLQILIPKGYPAIKLKKFFTTSDQWLTESPTTRTRLPPSFSTTIYKSTNHDLNHLYDVDLEKHFVDNGYKEDRIYGSNTLVIKHWLFDELMKMHDSNDDQMDTIDILTDYLLALNGNIAKLKQCLEEGEDDVCGEIDERETETENSNPRKSGRVSTFWYKPLFI